LASLEKKREALESDLVKFKAYIDAMENRKVKWTSILERLSDELDKSGQELKQIQVDKISLQEQITAQGLTPQDIDRMNVERDKLEKSLESTSVRIDDLSKTVGEKEVAAQSELETVEKLLQEYHGLLDRVGVSSSAAGLDITLDYPLADENLGKRPDALLPYRDIHNGIRPALQKYRDEIGQKVHKAQDESIRIQELLDRTSEGRDEKKEQVDTLEARLNADKITYEEMYETMVSDAAAANAEIERLERDLNAMKAGAQQGLLQLDSI